MSNNYHSGNKKRFGLQTSPWVLLSGVLILFIIVVVLAVQNINKEKENMSRILIEKGAAWIKAFEAGTRVGMRRMMRGEDHIQHLLEETASQSDVRYILVTDEQGYILAHNDTDFVGKKHIDGQTQASAVFPLPEQGRLVKQTDGQQIFEVFREFRPLNQREMARRMRKMQERDDQEMMSRAMRGSHSWFFQLHADNGRHYIFIGLDISPFEQARKEDFNSTLVISSVLLLLGFGGYISLYWVQNYHAARRSLQETSTFTDEVVASLPVGLIATDRNGKIAFFNTAAENIMAITQEDAFGRELEDVLPSDWCGLKEELEEGRTIIEREKTCTATGGEAIPVSISAARITSDEGFFLGNLVILRDIAEVRRLQAEIRRTEKLAAVGGLAAGIAHEIRNPLSSIKGIATYFRDKFSPASADMETAEVMIREVDRLNRVIGELLEFARPPELKIKRVVISDLISHSIKLVRQDANARQVKIQLPEIASEDTIELDPDRFLQCLLNLYLNAIQAMEKDGILTVRFFLEDRSAIIEVADTGHGIGHADQKHIFDPYYTTKPEGTGIGLAIVHKIVEAHAGHVRVSSTAGKGTTFRIILPT